jgi:hypothetical protein
MSRRTRRAAGTVAIVTLLLLTMGAGLSWAVNRAGVIEIDLRSKGSGGTDIHGLRIPGPLVEAALVCVPHSVFAEAREEMGDWGAFLRKTCQVLAKQDDFTLVEVRSNDEAVTIRKEGNQLVIDVDTADERVHVKVPIGLAEAVAKKIEKRTLWL